MRLSRIGTILLIAALFLLPVLVPALFNFSIEWLWFDSLGFSSVYSTILTTKIWLFFVGAFVFLGLLLANLFLVRRLSPPTGGNILTGQGLLVVRRAVDIGILTTASFISLIFGLVTSSQWEMVMRFAHATDFNVIEPLLGRDVGFYLFGLPLYHFIQGWLLWAAVLILLFTGALYILNIGFNLFVKGCGFRD